MAGVVGGDDQQHGLGCGIELAVAVQERAFDPFGEREAFGEALLSGELVCGERAAQLDEPERVAVGDSTSSSSTCAAIGARGLVGDELSGSGGGDASRW